MTPDDVIATLVSLDMITELNSKFVNLHTCKHASLTSVCRVHLGQLAATLICCALFKSVYPLGTYENFSYQCMINSV